MKLKRLVALVLSLTILIGIVPLNFVNAETQVLPIKVEDTAYGICDTDVVAKKITLEDGYSFVTHKVDYQYKWDNFGEGYAIVCDDATSTYYLVGTKGVVKSYYTDSGEIPSVESLFSTYSIDTPYAVYKVKNPETGKYDVYNANTGEYYEYGADKIYTFKSSMYDSDPDYCKNLIKVEKDGKFGVLSNSGKMIYSPIYSKFTYYENCLLGVVEENITSETGGTYTDYKYAILSKDGSIPENKFYDDVVAKDDILFAVRELTNDADDKDWALISTDNLNLLTDYKYTGVAIAKANGSYYRIGSLRYEKKNMYGDTTYYYHHEIITDSGAVVDVCSKFGCTSSSVGIYNSGVTIVENALKIRISDNYGYYQKDGSGTVNSGVVVPEFDYKYIIASPSLQTVYYQTDVSDDRHDEFFGRYGNVEVIEDADSGVNLYDNNHNLIANIYDDYEAFGDYILYENYGNSGSYVLYDTINKKAVLENLSISNYERHYGALLVKENQESTKYGIFDTETGNFSGYIFEGSSASVSELFRNEKRKAWEITIGESCTYINDEFKVISTAERYNGAGNLQGNETNLLRYNSESNDEYNMSIIDYDGKVKADFTTEVYYQFPQEAYSTTDGSDAGLINTDGRIIIENDADGVGTTVNGLTFVYTDGYWDSSASIVDKNGDALIYGEFDIDNFREDYRNIGHNGFISFKKDNEVFIYDYTDCFGYDKNTDSSVVTEDSLFGEYNSFLNNGFYDSMTETAVNQMGIALSHYGHSAKVVAFTKSAFDGNTEYVLRKLVSIIPQVDIDSKKIKQEMALEYLDTMDTDVVDDLLETVSTTKKIVGKISETKKGVTDLKNDIHKAKFAAIWTTENVSKSDVYKLIDVVNQNQDKFDKFMKNTGRTITAAEYLMTYLTIYMLQDGLVEELMKLVPKNSELYEGLNYIHMKQQKTGVVGFVVEMLTDDVFGFFADAIDEGMLAVANFKNPTLAGLVIELGCKLIAKNIDSPDLEAIDKATLALANTLTLRKAIQNYQTKIADNYRNGGEISVEDLKADYSLLCSTYYKSIFTGLKYAKEIATDNEKLTIERYTNEFEKKLIYRSYIKTCLLNARTRWEYTVKANKAVISKLKAEYPSGEGRLPWADLRYSFDADDSMKNVITRPEYALDVPATIDGYEVSGVGSGAFGGDDRVTGVYVPDSVTEIESNAFRNCSSVDTVYLGAGVETIGDSAFANCDSLSTIDIPDSVTSVGDNTFEGVKDLVVTGSSEELLASLNSENVTSKVRDKEIKAVEFVSEPTNKTMEMQAEIDTTGMVVKVTYSDDSTENIESGFYAEIADRKIGENTVTVCYNGFYLEYTVEITESQCSYTVSYLDETGNEIAEAVTGSALAGSILNLEIPEIQGYTPVNTEQSEVIGYNNDFVVRYTEIPKISIENAKVTVKNQNFAYKKLTPAVTVKVRGTTLTKNTDYTVAYYDNYYAGTATVIIQGKGNYEGLVTANFSIIEKAHKWSAWKIEEKATNDYPGVKIRTCECCNQTEYIYYCKKHQEYLYSKTPATYFAKGKEVYICGWCETKRTKTTKMLVLSTPKVTVQSGKKLFKVTYNKVKDATGFQVKYKYGKKTVTKTFNSKKKITVSINKLKKGSYTVNVRAMIKSGNKKAYSSWTKTKKITVK